MEGVTIQLVRRHRITRRDERIHEQVFSSVAGAVARIDGGRVGHARAPM